MVGFRVASSLAIEPGVDRLSAALWKEVSLNGDEQLSDSTFLECESVIQLMPTLEMETICEKVAEGAHLSAMAHRFQRRAQGFGKDIRNDEGLIRLPTTGAYQRAVGSNTPCAEPLSDNSSALADQLLQSALETIDRAFPDLVVALFESPSLLGMYQQGLLSFASREPAINVYSKGGKFHAHTDGQQLTILIPLTDDFRGGGTAFWSNTQRHRIDLPSIRLKPRKGTALVFGGHVYHSGLPVEEGERVVLVASMSRKMV